MKVLKGLRKSFRKGAWALGTTIKEPLLLKHIEREGGALLHQFRKWCTSSFSIEWSIDQLLQIHVKQLLVYIPCHQSWGRQTEGFCWQATIQSAPCLFGATWWHPPRHWGFPSLYLTATQLSQKVATTPPWRLTAGKLYVIVSPIFCKKFCMIQIYSRTLRHVLSFPIVVVFVGPRARSSDPKMSVGSYRLGLYQPIGSHPNQCVQLNQCVL